MTLEHAGAMEALTAYIPTDRLHALIRHQPLPEQTRGAALFADISGFTPLTEALTKTLGARRGAEELTHHLNRVYDALIAEVDHYGGSIISFNGDGITCWFDDGLGPHPSARDPHATVGATRRALACALAMQQAMQLVARVPVAEGESITLAMKVSVTSGLARRFLVGDPTIQQMDVLAGAMVDRLADAETFLRPGEVILDAQSIAILGDTIEISAWRGAADDSQPTNLPGAYAVVSRLNVLVTPRPWPTVPLVALSEDQIRLWMLPAIYERQQRGQRVFLAELRAAVVLFMRFGGWDYDNDPGVGGKLDRYIRHVQSILERYGGALLQVMTGDKGTHLYASFGAPITRDDTASSAIAAALELSAQPTDADLLASFAPVQIGLSQGIMRTGAYGGQKRRTYSVLGDEVNVAARLMQHATPGQIIATGRVIAAAKGRFRFRPLSPMTLKGKAEAIPVCEVVGKQSASHARTSAEQQRPMIGRHLEQGALAERIQQLTEGRPAAPVIIEGEAGIGKSHLVMSALQQAQAAGLRCLSGEGSAIERTTPYHAWRGIFTQLFQLESLPDDPAIRREHLLARLAPHPALLELAPLLNVVLPLNLPDNELTTPMSGQIRADNTAAFLTTLLQQEAATTPLLLVMEDVHWLDSASWEILHRVQTHIPQALQLITTRPIPDPQPPEYRHLLTFPAALHLTLTALPTQDVEDLICQRLGVASLPPQVAALIRTKAEGHPFFSEELAYALRDSGLILMTTDAQGIKQCQVAPQVDFSTLTLPTSVQEVIVSRIDRLPPAQQLALKVASVIGRVFAFQVLRDVHPVDADRPHLAQHLQELDRLELTPLDTPEPEMAYLFKHAITQEVAYNLMLFAQRRELHAAVAHWYEQRYASDLSPFYPLLAYHWQQAEALPQTLDYLEKAGQQALTRGVYKEAQDFYTQLIKMEARAATQYSQGTQDPDFTRRRAFWRSGLAQAQRGLGYMAESRATVISALQLLGDSAPQGTLPQTIALFKEVLRQGLYRLFPARFTNLPLSARERADTHEASTLYNTLSATYYVTNETAGLLHASLRRLNLADRLGPSREMVEVCGVMVYVCVTMRLYRLAEYYHTKALQADQQVNDPLGLASALMVSALARLPLGHWARIHDYASQAIELYARFGDWQNWGGAMATLMSAERYRGEYDFTLDLADEIIQVGQRNGDTLAQLWGVTTQALIALHRGHLDQAKTAIEATQPLLQITSEQTGDLLNASGLAQIAWHSGDFPQAQHYADQAAALIAKSPTPSAAHVYAAYLGVAQVRLALWEAAQQRGADAATLKKHQADAHQAIKYLRTCAMLFPLANSGLQLCWGLYHWHTGKPDAARKAWHKGLAAAHHYAMPLEEGLIHAELSRHAPESERQHHHAQAIAIFDRLCITHSSLNVPRPTPTQG